MKNDKIIQIMAGSDGKIYGLSTSGITYIMEESGCHGRMPPYWKQYVSSPSSSKE